jgi:hypothetical protein
MRRARHVACIGEISSEHKFLSGKLKGRNSLEHMGLNGRIILKWLLKNRLGGGDWNHLERDYCEENTS